MPSAEIRLCEQTSAQIFRINDVPMMQHDKPSYSFDHLELLKDNRPKSKHIDPIKIEVLIQVVA